MSRKVLDVGQCNADNSRITNLLKRNFDVEIHRCHSHDEAFSVALDTAFDLVLINRILDADGTEGMKVLSTLKSAAVTSNVPVMIVSNYKEAQEQAIAHGAVEGFGKSKLDSEETLAMLAQYLG